MSTLKTPQHKLGEYNVCRHGSEFKFFDGWRVRIEVENEERSTRAKNMTLSMCHRVTADDVVNLPDDVLKSMALRSMRSGMMMNPLYGVPMHLSLLTAHTNKGVIRRIYGVWDDEQPWVIETPQDVAMMMECQFVSTEGWLPL